MRSLVAFSCIAIVLMGLAFLLQSFTELNGDVAWPLSLAEKVLHGAKYHADFFETNPPLMLYLYIPGDILAKIASINVVTAVRFYIFGLILLSLVCCFILLRKIIPKEKFFLGFVFLYALLFVFLFLPAKDFGQREHLFFILTMPYFLTVVIAARNQKIHPLFAGFIGLMAGLGFALKPFFLAPLILVELYLMTRKLLGWMRIECLICAFTLVVYMGFVFWFHSAYLEIVLPLVSHWYFAFKTNTMANFFQNKAVIFCLSVLVYYWVSPKQSEHQDLIFVLVLACIGMIIAFTIPFSAWYYHILPAFGMAFIITMLCLAQLFSVSAQTNRDRMAVIGIGVLASFLLLDCMYFAFKRGWISQQTSRNELTNYINASIKEKDSIYCFTSWTTQDCFPLVYNTNSHFAGRFISFWWLDGMLSAEKKSSRDPHLEKDRQYFNDGLANDLIVYQPKIIIINTNDEKSLGTHFTFIDYFSQNEKFKQAWKSYYYLNQIGKYKIYQRVA